MEGDEDSDGVEAFVAKVKKDRRESRRSRKKLVRYSNRICGAGVRGCSC